MYDTSMHIGQPEITTRISVRELLVIEAEQMQQRRVQIMHVDLVLRRCESELIRRPVNEPLLQPPPASHIVKPYGL